MFRKVQLSSPRCCGNMLALHLARRGYASRVWILKRSFAFETGITLNFTTMHVMYIQIPALLKAGLMNSRSFRARGNHVVASVCTAGNVVATFGKHLASPSRLLCQCALEPGLRSVYKY